MSRRMKNVDKLVDVVRVVKEDITSSFGVGESAASVMNIIEESVSPKLLLLLSSLLQGFHPVMQVIMAENIYLFLKANEVRTTECPSVDATLIICYGWIACEKGYEIDEFKKKIKKRIYGTIYESYRK